MTPVYHSFKIQHVHIIFVSECKIVMLYYSFSGKIDDSNDCVREMCRSIDWIRDGHCQNMEIFWIDISSADVGMVFVEHVMDNG